MHSRTTCTLTQVPAEQAALPRLEIRLPRGLGAGLVPPNVSSAGPGGLYSCMGCNLGEAVGCYPPAGSGAAGGAAAGGAAGGARKKVMRQREGAPRRWTAVREPCLYYELAPMAAVCAMHADAERNFEFWWWCDGVEHLVLKPGVGIMDELTATRLPASSNLLMD